MVQKEREVKNAARREHLHQQSTKAKSKAKLARRLATKKAEREDATGELRRQRLVQNVPRTIEGTREWIGGSERLPQNGKDTDDEDDSEDEDEDKERMQQDADQGDARTRPVQIKSGGTGEDGEELTLDMAGLEDLFPQDRQQPEASTSQLPEHKPILLTTSPRPHGPTYDFLNEFQSLLGGKRYAHIVPRKNARFELSKVCKWAAKRGYGAIVVVGEDLHGEPATMTVSLLPEGPCAHFRLTSVQLHHKISNSANPTSHIPELVLSNFSTPLGLSTGRLLQSMFPPLPQIVGRQVVAVHNQRDFIFFRRFRYMFALRETEASRAAAKSQGRDEHLRTKMQEIGPRFTLKLRWLKRGALGTGRRKGADATTADSLLGDQNGDMEMGDADDNEVGAADAGDVTQRDQEEEAAARQEMLEQLGESEGQNGVPEAKGDDPAAADSQTVDDKTVQEHEAYSKKAAKKRKRGRLHSPGGSIHIPEFTAPTEIPKAELPHQRKIKKNASLLDSLAVSVAYGRGGTKKDQKEWEWDPRMQISRRKFAL